MPVRQRDESIYDRQRHLDTTKQLLGEDLWETRSGTPRRAFYGPGLMEAIKDGKHDLAHRVMQAFVRYWPYSICTRSPKWNNYGLLKPYSSRIATVTEFNDYGHQNGHVTRSSAWLQHLFLKRSVLPSYAAENAFDSVRLDIDVEIEGEIHDLYLLQQPDLMRVFAPWLAAIDGLREGVGPFNVEWMLSGYRGFWLSVFFTKPGTRTEALSIRQGILRSVGGDYREVNGKPIITLGDLTYNVDLGNLGTDPCRVPWSMHQATQNVAVNVDPEIGEPEPLQFVDTPPNESSLSEFSEWFPSCPEEPIRRMTGAEYRQFLMTFSTSPLTTAVIDEPEPASDPHSGRRHRRIGGGMEVDWDDEFHMKRDGLGGASSTDHITWSWRDVIDDARDGPAVADWRQLVERDAPDGQKRELIVMSGNLMNTARMMKYQHGEIDWCELAYEYEQAYLGADWSRGGTIRDWIGDMRRDTNDGATLIPVSPWVSEDEVERCRQFADELPIQRRQRDPMFRLLLVMRRESADRDEFEASEDYLARRAEINPYATWEEQEEDEYDPEDARCHRKGDGRPKHPTKYPTSINARNHVKRLLKKICDMDVDIPAPTGLHPFWRRSSGTNHGSDPRVIEAGRRVGSIYAVVRSHPFWED